MKAIKKVKQAENYKVRLTLNRKETAKVTAWLWGDVISSNTTEEVPDIVHDLYWTLVDAMDGVEA